MKLTEFHIKDYIQDSRWKET